MSKYLKIILVLFLVLVGYSLNKKLKQKRIASAKLEQGPSEPEKPSALNNTLSVETADKVPESPDIASSSELPYEKAEAHPQLKDSWPGDSSFDEKYLTSFEGFLNDLNGEAASQIAFDTFMREHSKYDPEFNSIEYLDEQMSSTQKAQFYKLLINSSAVDTESKRRAYEQALKSLRPVDLSNEELKNAQMTQTRMLILDYVSLGPSRDSVEEVVRGSVQIYHDPMFTSIVALDLRENGWSEVLQAEKPEM